jgi:hypothetical protein
MTRMTQSSHQPNLLRVSAKTRNEAPIGFLENLARPLAIEALLGKCLGVPFAAVGGKQITSINAGW